MSTESAKKVGSVGWMDLTVPHAETIRDFYEAVVGWNHKAVSMGEYDDFTMTVPGNGDGVAGICHRRGANRAIPSQWMIYINVADLAASLEQCRALGGAIVVEARTMPGYGRYGIIQDPAGAVAALFEPEG